MITARTTRILFLYSYENLNKKVSLVHNPHTQQRFVCSINHHTFQILMATKSSDYRFRQCFMYHYRGYQYTMLSVFSFYLKTLTMSSPRLQHHTIISMVKMMDIEANRPFSFLQNNFGFSFVFLHYAIGIINIL